MRRATFGVIGVGTVGAMSAWQIAKRGHSVVGFEQHSPGHQLGAAAGDTRWVRIASEEGAYIPLVQRALPLWRELEGDSGMSLLDQCGGLYVGPPNGRFMRSVTDNCKRHNLPHERLDPNVIRARYPHLRVGDDETGVYEADAGYVQASASVVAAARAAEDFGAIIHRYAPVTSVDPTRDGVIVTAGGEAWAFDKVVIATGAWGRVLLPNSIPHLEIERFLVSWYPFVPESPWALPGTPIFERQGDDFIFGSWPSVDGASVKVGFAAPVDTLRAAEEMHQRYSQKVVELTDEYVSRWLGDVIPQSVRHAAGMDAHASDRDFILGALEQHPNVIVALGQAGHGFKMSPTTGELVGDLLEEREPHLDLSRFRPERFTTLPYLDFDASAAMPRQADQGQSATD